MKMSKETIDVGMFAPCGMNCKVCYKHCYHKKTCAGCLNSDKGKPEESVANVKKKLNSKNLKQGGRADVDNPAVLLAVPIAELITMILALVFLQRNREKYHYT